MVACAALNRTTHSKAWEHQKTEKRPVKCDLLVMTAITIRAHSSSCQHWACQESIMDGEGLAVPKAFLDYWLLTDSGGREVTVDLSAIN